MNYFYAQTLCYLEYFKKIVAFLQILRLYIKKHFIRAWCELDFAKTETAIEQSLFLQNYKVYTKIGHADEEKSRCIMQSFERIKMLLDTIHSEYMGMRTG